MKVDHQAEISLLLHAGVLNSYMAGYLMRRNFAGLDEQMWDEALSDAEQASKLGVDNDREFRLWFYIDGFADQLQSGLSQEQLEDLKAFLFAKRNEVGFEQVEDFRSMANQWAQSKNLSKLAYPNVGLPYKALPQYSQLIWGDLVERINKSVKMGVNRQEALTEAAAELKTEERLDFLSWYSMHASGEAAKYDLGPRIREVSSWTGKFGEEQMELTKIAEAADERFYYLPKFRNQPFQPAPKVEPEVPAQNPAKPQNERVEQDARDFESARQKLVSRTFSIDKLLEKYKRVLKPDQIDGIEDSLNELRKKIRKLKMAASIRDSLVKTAGIFENLDFKEGARELRSLAADEQVLATDSEAQMSAQKRNELISATVQKLNEVVNALKGRDLIRTISEVDILLAQLSMASFFPEMQEAQAKLIEAFGYASNRIEDIVPKLRGALPNPADPTDQLRMPVSKTDDPLAQLQQMADEAKQTGVVHPPPPTTTELKEKNKEDKERAKLHEQQVAPQAPAAEQAQPAPPAPAPTKPKPSPELEEVEGLKELNLPARRRPVA